MTVHVSYMGSVVSVQVHAQSSGSSSVQVPAQPEQWSTMSPHPSPSKPWQVHAAMTAGLQVAGSQASRRCIGPWAGHLGGCCGSMQPA